MPLWDRLDDELATLRNFHEKRRTADQMVASIDEEAAYRATMIHDAYNFLPPGASIALAAAGIGPDSDVVHRLASTYVRAQNAASVAPYGSTVRQGDMPNYPVIQQSPQALAEMSAPQKALFKKYGVIYDVNASKGGNASAGGVLGAVKDAASGARDPMTAVRGLTRAADTVGRVVPQMVQNQYRHARSDVQDKGLVQTFRDNLTSPTAQLGNIFESYMATDLGAAQAQLQTEGRVDTGRGFFLNDEKEVGQRRKAQELTFSPTITYADGSRHIATIGRDIAGGLGLEPGSRGYSIVSGLGDAAVVIATSKATGAAGQERRAAKAFKSVAATEDGIGYVRRARESAGALMSPGRRLTYDPDLARTWLDGPRGTEVVDWIKGTTNTRTLDAVTGGKLDPSLLRRLADETTDHGVKRALMDAIEQGDLRKQVNVTAGQVAPWKRTGIAVKSNLPWRTRALELVPDTRVKLDDARAVLDQTDRWAAAMKLAPEERDALHDALTKVRDTPSYLGDDPLADKARILAHRKLAMSERRNVIVESLRNGADRYMEPYAKWKAIADDDALDAGTRMAARERVDKAQGFIDEVLRLGNRLEDAETAYWRDAANTNRSFFGAMVGDEVLQPARMSPTLIADHVGDTMAMPNPRDVREAFNSPLVKAVMKTPGAAFTKHTLEFAMDKVWKPSHLLRLAFPVRVIGDEQARIFAEGGDSIYNHPIRAIAWALGDSKFKNLLPDQVQLGRGDVRGRLFDRADDWARGLNKSDQAFWQDVHYKRMESWAPFKHGQDGFEDAWATALGRLHSDQMPQVLLGSENIDEAKRVWWDNLGDVRARLAESHPPSRSNPTARSGADLMARSGADAYVDDVAEQLQHITQGDPRLIEAVRTGRLTTDNPDVIALAREGGGELSMVGGVERVSIPMYLDDGMANPVFSQALKADFDDVAARGFTNRELVGRRTAVSKEQQHVWDRAVTKAFSLFLGKPDDFLARSPYARQSYWDEVRARVAYLHPDDVDALVANAEAAKLPRDQLRTIKRMAGKAGRTGDDALTIDELHQLGVAQAVDRTQDLLYDLSKRHQLADMTKLIAPFGEAWAEVLKVWGRELSQPARWAPLSQTARALRSPEAGAVVNPGDAQYDTATGEMRQRGLFYRDENGNEMLTFPLTRQMMGMVGLPEVPMVGRVQGLSVGFDVMPGLGPVAQIPMAGMNDRFEDPKYDGMREMLFPYGVPRGSLVDQVTNQATPAWLQKVLNVNGGYDDRAWTSVVIDNMRYLASTDGYDVSGTGASQEEITRLVDDSKTNARWMTLLRGMGQFAAPTAPSYEWALEDKSGKRISALTLSRELHELQNDEDPEKADRAVLIFLERHGAGAFAMLQGKTISVSPAGGLPPTERAAAWLADNEFAQSEYALAYGLFAPRAEDDKIDSNLYWSLVEGGERAQVDPEVALKLANRKVAQAAYYSVRNKLGENLTAEQSLGLYEFRQELERRYPGYSANGDAVPGTPVKASTEQVIADMKRAVADERLADNPLTKPLQAYLTVRDQVERMSTEATGRAGSWTSSKDAVSIRQGMFKLGSELAGRSPEFKAAWESVLLNEFDAALVDDGRGG